MILCGHVWKKSSSFKRRCYILKSVVRDRKNYLELKGGGLGIQNSGKEVNKKRKIEFRNREKRGAWIFRIRARGQKNGV